MNKNLVGLTAMIVCVLLASWAFGLFGGESVDPKVAELEQEAKKMEEMPIEKRMEYGREFREKVRESNLSEEQRRELRDRMGPWRRKMGQAFMDSLIKMEVEERNAMFDKFIDMQEAHRKEREADSGGQDGGQGNRATQTPEQREAMIKGIIERTTPDERARFEAVMTMFNQRREERGLDPVGPGGFFGRGPRGGGR